MRGRSPAGIWSRSALPEVVPVFQVLDEPRILRLPPEHLPGDLAGDRVVHPDGPPRVRGLGDTAAALAARTCMIIMQVAFAQWVDNPDQIPFQQRARDALAQLREIAVAG